MLIGIDGRLAGEVLSGIGRYTRELVTALLTLDGFERYALFFDRPGGLPWVDSRIHPWLIPVPRRFLWTHLYLPRVLDRAGLACYHATSGFDLPWRSPCPSVATMHDVIPLVFPHLTPWRHRLFFRIGIGLAVRRAACIVTVSEGVREELMGRLGVAADRITVIHEAAPPGFEPVENPSRLGAIRERYHLPPRFVLFVGLLEPKKNLPRLLDALGRLHAGGEKIPLVLAGARGWAVDDLDARVASSGLASSVRFLGPVPDEDLAALYSAADCFCFPSLYEGFGLPVLEAMACGTPVVASTRGALPELTAGAALLVDPLDVGALAEAIRRLWNDGTLRLELRERGLTRAKAFSWQRAAQETLAVYHRAAPR